MLLTLYSMVMAVLLSSVLILIISVLRRSYYFMDISSVYGMVLLYLLCLARIFIPVEFSWTKVIRLPIIYNKLFLFFTRELFYIGTYNVCIYHLIYIVWIAGAMLMFISIFYEYYKYRNKIRNLSVDLENPNIKIARKIVEKKYNKNVKIVISPDISEPVSFGIIHRKILIPDYPYSGKELYYIVSHECAHLKNHDLIVYMLVNIFCAIYWWNPLVYSLRSGLVKSFEVRCDHMVVKDLSQKETAYYLETILKVFKNQNGLPYDHHNKAGLLGIGEDNTQEIKERFKLVSRMKAKKTRPFGKWAVTIIMMCLIVLSYSFVLQTYFQAPAGQIEASDVMYELTGSNGYILKYADGTYVLKSERGDETIINKESADYLVKEKNYKIIEEKIKYEAD